MSRPVDPAPPTAPPVFSPAASHPQETAHPVGGGTAHSPAAPALGTATVPRALWVMLLTLLSGFALSQAFRTTASIMALGLQTDFGMAASSLGAFAGLFGLSFGVAQLLVGIGMDVYGLRPTVLRALPLAALGAAVSAAAPSYGWLMAGQLLIGVGCSPAFLACTMFISRYFPAQRFAFFSGLSMGVGGLGLLFTGTPLAWIVEHGGWRSGFGLLSGLCVLSWLCIYRWVQEPVRAAHPASGVHPADAPAAAPPERWGPAFLRMAELLTVPHTWGIVLLGMSCYAAFLTLRGLWLGPLLMERHGFSLLHSGHVALAMSLISLFTPVLFGRLDPGPLRRRQWVANASLLMAALFVVLAYWPHAAGNVVVLVLMAWLMGYTVLQYADVRASYTAALTGRALSLFTMAMFLGVALMQWVTGWVAVWASAHGYEPHQAVNVAIAMWLAVASTAFRCLPASPLLACTKA